MAGVLVAAAAGRSDEVARLARAADPGVLDDLPVHAGYHGVVGPVHLALREVAAVPEHIRGELARRYHLSLSSHLRISADLGWAADRLDRLGVGWVVVKGPALAATYARPDLRTYKDLDLLVGPADFPVVVRHLESAGATVLDRNWTLVRQELRGQLHLQLPGGTVSDLHWHLVNQRRDRLRIVTDELLVRAVRTTIGDREVPVLDAVDALLHVCLHAALSGGDRLIWLADAAASSSVLDGTAWSILITRARSWGATTAAGLVLARAARSLGAPVPDAVVRALLPTWTGEATVRLVDLIEPVGSRTAAPTPARLVTRAAAWGAREGIRDGVARSRRRLQRIDDRAVLTNPMYRNAGGTDDREAYLADVAAQGRGGGP
jgi:hypothetical protein